MTTNHTPGPWKYQNANGVAHVYAPSHNITIYEDAPKGSDAWAEETHANARLIAAAPELLSILKPFIEIWEKGGSDYAKHMDDYWGYDNLSKARAAIAKAAGQ